MAESRTSRIFVRNISRLRESHQYTVSQVAEFLNVGAATVSKYENGLQWPKAQTIDRFADLYKMSVADLFTPEGAAAKAFSLAATEDNLREAINIKMRAGEYELRRVKK